MELKEFLNLQKLKHGISARYIARELDITEQHLSKLSKKAYAPSRLLAKKIESYTGGLVTCMELLYP